MTMFLTWKIATKRCWHRSLLNRFIFIFENVNQILFNLEVTDCPKSHCWLVCYTFQVHTMIFLSCGLILPRFNPKGHNVQFLNFYHIPTHSMFSLLLGWKSSKILEILHQVVVISKGLDLVLLEYTFSKITNVEVCQVIAQAKITLTWVQK